MGALPKNPEQIVREIASLSPEAAGDFDNILCHYIDLARKWVSSHPQAPGAASAVNALIADLKGRRGLKHEWDGIDEETLDEIRTTWIAIVYEHTKEPP